MATRKKRVAENGSTARGFAIVVEQMQGHFKVFGEQLGALREQVTSLDHKVTSLDHKVTSLDHKVTSLDHKVTALDDKVTTGFAQVELRFERVEHEIGLLKVAVIEQGRELKKKVDRDEVEAIVERVIARHA